MKLTLTLVFFVVYSHCFAQNDWKLQGLKGKVKSVTTQETYRYKKNGVAFIPWEKTYSRSYQFDNTGRYTEFKEKKSDGTGGYTIKYTNKIKEKKIEQAYFDKDDKATITKIITLDDKGRTSDLLEFTKENKPDRSYFYTYDDKGNNSTLTSKRADGTVSSTYTYTYDDKKQKTDQRLETPGYANSYISWRYDSKGNQTDEAWYNGKKEMTFRFERVYDDKGNKIEESKYKNGDAFLDKVTWKYEYDKKGNWIKRTQYTKTGEDFQIDERVIVYY
jgi:hypothetical protein